MTTHRKYQVRRPSWWIVLADDKSNRVVVPPTKITDVPLSDPSVDRNYRPYKVQFQGPPNTGLFTWRVYIISDTFVGEEVSADITVYFSPLTFMVYSSTFLYQLKVENPPVAEESQTEDEISDPDEDSLAGQMAAMKGQPVKKRLDYSDDESGTDDDDTNDTSDSDSDQTVVYLFYFIHIQ